MKNSNEILSEEELDLVLKKLEEQFGIDAKQKEELKQISPQDILTEEEIDYILEKLITEFE